MTTSVAVHPTAATLFRVTLLVADRPRAIDRVIDYFGNPPCTHEAHQPRDFSQGRHELTA